MRLGAVTRGSEAFAGPLVAGLRERKDSPETGDAEKLAFVLGTMTHRAADRMMKPILKSQTADGEYAPIEISVYHDIFLFDRLYGRGAKEPYTPDALSPVVSFPAFSESEAKAFEEYFRVLFQRALLAAHTFKPDQSDPEVWLARLFDWLQEFDVDLERYHRALVEPDAELARRAIADVNFYADEDPIIRLLEDLRAGRDVAGDDFTKRLTLRDRDSLYARAVSLAYGYLHVTGEYWEGRAADEFFLDSVRR
jgi:hypothetical protein